MQELHNPLNMALYGIDAATGLVQVRHEGRLGLYSATGEWRSGDKFDVCPHMCLWVGGPNPVQEYSVKDQLSRR